MATEIEQQYRTRAWQFVVELHERLERTRRFADAALDASAAAKASATMMELRAVIAEQRLAAVETQVIRQRLELERLRLILGQAEVRRRVVREATDG